MVHVFNGYHHLEVSQVWFLKHLGNVAHVLLSLSLSLLSEQLTAIFAFGSCGGFSGRNIVSVFCGDGRNETLSASFHYPFR